MLGDFSRLLPLPLLIISGVHSLRAEDVPSPAEIADWVQELNADRYESRSAATRKLSSAGAAAVPAVTGAILGSGNLEVQIRGLEVLEKLALSDDSAANVASWQALQELKRCPLKGVAHRATETLHALADVRSQRALRALVQLGAEIVEIPGGTVLLGGRAPPSQVILRISGQWKGQADDLPLLRELTNVAKVELEGEQVTDAFLLPLAEIETLQHISARRTRISANGLAYLEKLNHLQTCSFRYTPLTDDAVEHIARLRRPHSIQLYGTNITPAGAERLGKLLPHAALDIRDGTFLGVRPPQILAAVPPQGCVLGEVQPESAAQAAGLQLGDVIAEYEGQAVADFAQLQKMIARNKAGDKVTVQIRRDGKNLTKQIVLGEWPATHP